MHPFQQLLGVVIVGLGAYAVVRRIDVRMALLLCGLALGALAGNPGRVFEVFGTTLAKPDFVLPICTAMGFAFVLASTGCDRHLVRLLTRPMRRIRPLLIPGSVVVGFLMNATIISQTSTAAAVGPVLLPLLRAAGISPVTAGAALLLGASVGGELLNPGGPEMAGLAAATRISPAEVLERAILRHMLPIALTALAVATLVFWCQSLRKEIRVTPEAAASGDEPVHYLKAMVPLVPLALLIATTPLLGRFRLGGYPEGMPVHHAMLVGILAAWAVAGRDAPKHAAPLFEGMGFAFAQIIGIIVAAYCFTEGIRLLGYLDLAAAVVRGSPRLAAAGSLTLTWGLGVLTGSGMAPSQALIPVMVSLAADPDAQLRLGCLVAQGGALGRTMSPVAAVVFFCAAAAEATPLDLVRRVAPPLLLAGVAILLVALAGGY